MGIPSFYRWLVQRYPLSVVEAVEEDPAVVNGVKVPVDSSQPNPNGLEYDNLYLDMNGIIHPCFHPEGLPPPKTYDEVFKEVFKYIDRLFSIIRPRKLLYMAIDGVAPRAKMNQQRARRFKTAKDAAEEAAGTESGVSELDGENLNPQKLDSNVITPGTEFMSLLSSALQYYVHLRMNNDPGWQGIKVILSDASVPGEGEHKIMSYIRLQRNLPGFDPNTLHCLYGLDADLIMLALATHEIHFSILREDIRNAQTDSKSRKQAWKKKGEHLKQEEICGENIDLILRQKFQFLNIWVLRDYLAHDLRIRDPTVNNDLERFIDDFVFMCLFVGNDFLPHMPSLEISEGAIDLLMFVYKKEFVRMGGYLTDSLKVNLKHVEHFVRVVGSHEIAIFRRRNQAHKEREIRFRGSSVNSNVKKIQNSVNHNSDGANYATDKVKLGEEGWKERYYTEKFETKTDDDRQRVAKHAVIKYIEGICWVMHYYYQGVCSWNWFYPYHYAPFASDFYGLDQLEINFTLGKPFKPFDQLMGVLPAASAQALPLFYRELMTDPSSPILEFYPSDFQIDLNGKRHAWQGVCKLPFINECCLMSEIAKVEHTLTDEERKRNSEGIDVLFVHKSHPLTTKIVSFSDRWSGHPKLYNLKVKLKVKPRYSGGMNGYLYISNKPVCPVEISTVDGMEIITENKVMSVFFRNPLCHPHIPRPPKGVKMPEKSISKQDIHPPPVLWHEKSAILGRVFSERPIPKSVMGSCLSKLAHQLVSIYYLPMQQEKLDEGRNYTKSGPRGKKHSDHDSLCNEIDQMDISEKHGQKRRKKHGSPKQQENMDYEGRTCTTGGEPEEREQNEDCNILNNEIEQTSASKNQRTIPRKKRGASKQEENMNGGGNNNNGNPKENKQKENLCNLSNGVEQTSVSKKCRTRRKQCGALKQEESMNGSGNNDGDPKGSKQNDQTSCSLSYEIDQKSVGERKRKRRENHSASKQQEDMHDVGGNYTSVEPGKRRDNEDQDCLYDKLEQKTIGKKCRKKLEKMVTRN